MGDSWQWQLRDRLGQWMDMNSEVRWLAKGKLEQGHIVGSPEAGMATVEKAGSHQRVQLPTSRLTAITVPGGKALSPGRPSVPKIPKDFSSLSDDEMVELYWATRDHPDVPTHTWFRVAWETIHKRKIALDPHVPLGEGVFAAGTPTPSQAEIARLMQIRIIERELGLR